MRQPAQPMTWPATLVELTRWAACVIPHRRQDHDRLCVQEARNLVVSIMAGTTPTPPAPFLTRQELVEFLSQPPATLRRNLAALPLHNGPRGDAWAVHFAGYAARFQDEVIATVLVAMDGIAP